MFIFSLCSAMFSLSQHQNTRKSAENSVKTVTESVWATYKITSHKANLCDSSTKYNETEKDLLQSQPKTLINICKNIFYHLLVLWHKAGQQPRIGHCRRNNRNLCIFSVGISKRSDLPCFQLTFWRQLWYKKRFSNETKRHKKGTAQATLKSKNRYRSFEILLPFFLSYVAGVIHVPRARAANESLLTSPHFLLKTGALDWSLACSIFSARKWEGDDRLLFSFIFAISLCRTCRYLNPLSSLLGAIGLDSFKYRLSRWQC